MQKDVLIYKQAAIDGLKDRYYKYGRFAKLEELVWMIEELPSAQQERLTDDDFETIRIHLNAYKEKLYNERRWKEAEEYQRIIDRFMAFASSQPEQRWIPCSERLPEEYGEYRITWTTSASKKRFVGDSEYEVTGEWDDKRNDFKGEWLLDDYIKTYPDVKVIAWKTIEEPYIEDGEAE